MRYSDEGRDPSHGRYLFKTLGFVTIQSNSAPNSQSCHDEVVQAGAEIVNHCNNDKRIAASAPAAQEHVQRDEEVAENNVDPVGLDEHTSIVKILAIHDEELPFRGKNGHCAKTADQDGDEMDRERILAQLGLNIVEYPLLSTRQNF